MAASKREYMNYNQPLESEIPTEWLVENEMVDLFVAGKDIRALARSASNLSCLLYTSDAADE